MKDEKWNCPACKAWFVTEAEFEEHLQRIKTQPCMPTGGMTLDDARKALEFGHKLLVYRGSGSDLATDVMHELPDDEVPRFVSKLMTRLAERGFDDYGGKFPADGAKT